MKIAILVDEEKLLTDFKSKCTLFIYECYGELKSIIYKKDIYSFREFYEIAYSEKIDCILLTSIDDNSKRLLEDLKINYFVLKKNNIDNVFADFYHFDNASINYQSELAKHQQFSSALEFSEDFSIGYFDDDDIGGS